MELPRDRDALAQELTGQVLGSPLDGGLPEPTTEADALAQEPLTGQVVGLSLDEDVTEATAEPAKMSAEASRTPPDRVTEEKADEMSLDNQWLASVAKSPTGPKDLAEALVGILGDTDAAMKILQDSLDHLALSSNSVVQLERLSVTLPSNSMSGVDLQPLRRSDSIADGTEVSVSAIEDEDMSREQLQIIKARTMYNMVEEIDDGKCKLLFLTNPQADLIASTPESVQKMLDALEVPKPSLVIELVMSWGFRTTTKMFRPETYQSDKELSGIVFGQPPFLTREEEREAEAKLDMFMADVVIPLAAQTHAVVLCDAIVGNW